MFEYVKTDPTNVSDYNVLKNLYKETKNNNFFFLKKTGRESFCSPARAIITAYWGT